MLNAEGKIRKWSDWKTNAVRSRSLVVPKMLTNILRKEKLLMSSNGLVRERKC